MIIESIDFRFICVWCQMIGFSLIFDREEGQRGGMFIGIGFFVCGVRVNRRVFIVFK